MGKIILTTHQVNRSKVLMMKSNPLVNSIHFVCGVEKAGSGNGTQSADVFTDDVDMKEVNLLMDEMVEFYNDSEETGAAIEESLAKSINSSLRSKIPESKFKEMKAKYKRPENCGNLMIPKVNEQVWTEKHPMMNSIRSRDLNLQKIMGYTIKGMIPDGQ